MRVPQRAQRPHIGRGHPRQPRRLLEHALQHQRVDVDQARLQQVQREHGKLLILEPVGRDLAALAEKDEALRREIHEGLNVIERWNGANDFVFFAKRGELASNRSEDHELSMLCLHLLQNCMVYINTLMLQRVLERPHWAGRLTKEDLRALTPLIWEHVNPYGRYELDMESRLVI